MALTALVLDGQKRDIVALWDAVYKVAFCLADGLDEGARIEPLFRQGKCLLTHPLTAKLIVADSLGLRIAVGIEEQGRILVDERLLL